MNESTWDFIGVILGVLVVIAGVYGFVLDIFHGHVMWALLDVVTSGVIAVIRGIGYAFGWIAY